MILCDKKILFIHIPKTGGSSIETALNARKDHLYLSEWKTMIDYKKYKIFSFVRNPWDRLVSSFCFSKRPNSVYATTENINEFEIYLKNAIQVTKTVRDSFNKSETDPAIRWLKGDYDQVNIDFIGQYEHLERDFKTVCELFNLGNYDLPHINKTNRSHYSLYYRSQNIIDLVYENYYEDIKMFDYKFKRQKL